MEVIAGQENSRYLKWRDNCTRDNARGNTMNDEVTSRPDRQRAEMERRLIDLEAVFN